jgi:catechol 2,3-dioxygenase-like lactoylglutathione lyase family enzyme
MITAVHTLIYADDAERARAFLRDVLGWPCVDSGGGWLIFRTGPGEMGVHPTSEGGGASAAAQSGGGDATGGVESGGGDAGGGVESGGGDGSGGAWSTSQHHEITLMCDDITATVAELRGRGVEFLRGIRDDGFGLTTAFAIPGAGSMMLYQPAHPTAFDLPERAPADRDA